MTTVLDVARYINGRLNTITEGLFAEHGLQFTDSTYYNRIKNIKVNTNRDVTMLITRLGTQRYAAQLRDVYQHTWRDSETSDLVYDVCMDLVVEASKPTGLALQLIKDNILKIKNVKLKYRINTFEEIAFTEVPRDDEWSPEVISGNDLRTIENRLWETPEKIIQNAVATTQRRFKIAFDVIQRGILNKKDGIGQATGLRVMSEIKDHFE